MTQDSEIINQFYLLIAVYGLTTIIWLAAALSAFSGYRAFRVRIDLGWTLAFLLLALVRGGEASVAYQTAIHFGEMGITEASATEFALSTRISLAALEIIAAFAVFYLFRSRHAYIRRQVELT